MPRVFILLLCDELICTVQNNSGIFYDNKVNNERQVQPHMRGVRRGGGVGQPLPQILSHRGQGDS